VRTHVVEAVMLAMTGNSVIHDLRCAAVPPVARVVFRVNPFGDVREHAERQQEELGFVILQALRRPAEKRGRIGPVHRRYEFRQRAVIAFPSC
jgi:hypothetical protein